MRESRSANARDLLLIRASRFFPSARYLSGTRQNMSIKMLIRGWFNKLCRIKQREVNATGKGK
jgi:hypothetical protein